MADITRKDWVEKSSEQSVKAAENLIRLFTERSSKDYQPSYTNSYIGLRLEGKPCNFFVVIPQKQTMKLSVKVEASVDNAYYLKQVATKKIDYTNGWYNVSIAPDADCTEVMAVLLQAETEFMGKENTDNSCSGKMHTYYLRISAPVLWRFDTINLDNVDDDGIQEAFEEQYGLINIIGETANLDMRKDDIDYGDYFGYDEDEVEELRVTIGDNNVKCSPYMPDAEEPFSIVVMDENNEELETIDSDDVISFDVEPIYGISLDHYDEDGPEFEAAKLYMEKNNISEGDMEAVSVFPMAEPGCWYWLNTQRCRLDEPAILKLCIPDKFDPSKLSFKKTLIEEIINGLNSIEVISAIMYDGKIIEVDAEACGEEYDSTNYVIKMEDNGHFPEKVYDMTNKEES